MKLRRIFLTLVILGAATWAAAAVVDKRADDKAWRRAQATAMTGGDPARGRQAIRQYGCSTCHTIPGVPGATALVGPSLDQVASRHYIAGVLENTPQNMLRWLMDPPAVDEKTAMPNVGLNESDARDIASYLYTLN